MITNRTRAMGPLMIILSLALGHCGSDPETTPDPATTIKEGACKIKAGAKAPDELARIACKADFDALSSEPIDATLPGSRSVKVVLDQADDDTLHFQNSQKYKIHYEFASKHLSGGERPIVPQLSDFNTTEYYKPDRRFLLGSVTYYEGPKVWALEIAPYDTASVEMITKLYEKVSGASYFGPALVFHPTSQAVAAVAAMLDADVAIMTTDEIYAGTDFQPLTLGESMGRLHFVKAADLEDEYLSYRDIIVLDDVPNDIAVVSGLITAQFQTPLSHVNVLSQNRGTPNMGLRDAMTNEKLRALDGKWVQLVVSAGKWTVKAVTRAQADAYFEKHRPKPVTLPALDLETKGLFDIDDVVVEDGSPLRDLLKKALTAFGGKATHYSVLAQTDDVPILKAFAIPVYYYDEFMRENAFYERVEAMLADDTFIDDPTVRDENLAQLRKDMAKAPVNQAFQDLLKAKLAKDYAGFTMRFRTSTNSEDLDGFPCAGCYESHTGDPADWEDVLDAIRETYSTIWLFRTFEERTYYGIDHTSVGMALLVHHNFPDEEANGVAVTANPFDASGLEPGFYINVQEGGDAEVVAPPPGVTSDEFLYFFDSPNQPITFLSHSNLIPEGETVLTLSETHALGVALHAIHERFSAAYGPAAGNNGWYAMDVELKFDAPKGKSPKLYIKQARPYPGRGN